MVWDGSELHCMIDSLRASVVYCISLERKRTTVFARRMTEVHLAIHDCLRPSTSPTMGLAVANVFGVGEKCISQLTA